MGYTTDFMGSLSISPALTPKQMDYINLLSETRRMKRDVNKLMEIYKGKHGYPFTKSKDPKKIYGKDGEFFAKKDDIMGQSRDESIIDYNTSPGLIPYSQNMDFNTIWEQNQKAIKGGDCQPGLWCQWVIIDGGNTLEWDGGEKFYNYVEWLKYLINRFFSKWSVYLNGEITWEGEDSTDLGKIQVSDNVVKVLTGHVSYSEE